MNRLPLDAPAGTQVLVAWKHGDTFGGPRLDRTVTTSEPFTQSGSVWPTLVRLACDDHPFRIDQVYLDEPAPGTWAWACERALITDSYRDNRPAVVRDNGRVRMFGLGVDLRVRRLFGKTWVDSSPIVADVTATDWEIAK